MQENPFFSQPLIFYGSHEESEESDEEEFLENQQIWLDHDRIPFYQPRIGLFFYWFPPIE